jgi:hypothetical protein
MLHRDTAEIKTFMNRKLLAASVMIAAIGAVSASAGAMTITPNFESSITGSSNAGTIESDINNALTFYDQNVLNPITVSIDFGISTNASYLGQSSSTNYSPSYNTYTSDMLSNATTYGNAIELSAYSNLQYGNDKNGAENMTVTAPDMRAITGDSSYNGNYDTSGNYVGRNGTVDGVITLNATDLSGFGYNGSFSPGRVIQHEVDEILGIGGSGSTLRSSSTPATTFGPMDLFRYSAPQTPSYTNSSTATSYFSIDGGTINLVNFNQNPGTNGQTGGDFGDWSSEGTTGNYVQLAFTSSSQGAASISATSPEGIALQAIGYEVAVPEPSTVALFGGLLIGLGLLRRRATQKT